MLVHQRIIPWISNDWPFDFQVAKAPKPSVSWDGISAAGRSWRYNGYNMCLEKNKENVYIYIYYIHIYIHFYNLLQYAMIYIYICITYEIYIYTYLVFWILKFFKILGLGLLKKPGDTVDGPLRNPINHQFWMRKKPKQNWFTNPINYRYSISHYITYKP